MKQLFNPIAELSEDGKLTGILLIIATAISMIITNSGVGSAYIAFWEREWDRLFYISRCFIG
jgi:NhaA family Na+:H+ antiporter